MIGGEHRFCSDCGAEFLDSKDTFCRLILNGVPCRGVIESARPAFPTKCASHGCTNRRGEGDFVGKFCAPCDHIFTTGEIHPSDGTVVKKYYQEKKWAEKWMGRVDDILSGLHTFRERTLVRYHREQREYREAYEKKLQVEMPAVVPAKSERRSCNLHDDCNAADEEARMVGRQRPDHCGDDGCEECFGY